MSEFKDTVSFRINSRAPAGTLHAIASLKGVFALRAASVPDTFHVELAADADAGTVLEQIRWRDGIEGSTITPQAFHELSARIAAEQGRTYNPLP